MKYAKIVDGVVVQIQPIQYDEDKKPILVDGFIEVKDDVVCGMIDNGDDTFSNPQLTQSEAEEQAIEHFKSLYLEIFNSKLKELDYDSIATVQVWMDDVTFGVEATRIMNWYKALITKNYVILDDAKTSGVIPTDEYYLDAINSVVF